MQMKKKYFYITFSIVLVLAAAIILPVVLLMPKEKPLTISVSDYDLKVGDLQTIEYKVSNPYAVVTLEISDTTILEKEGANKVRALKEGCSTITLTAKFNNQTTKASSFVFVEVDKPEIPKQPDGDDSSDSETSNNNSSSSSGSSSSSNPSGSKDNNNQSSGSSSPSPSGSKDENNPSGDSSSSGGSGSSSSSGSKDDNKPSDSSSSSESGGSQGSQDKNNESGGSSNPSYPSESENQDSSGSTSENDDNKTNPNEDNESSESGGQNQDIYITFILVEGPNCEVKGDNLYVKSNKTAMFSIDFDDLNEYIQDIYSCYTIEGGNIVKNPDGYGWIIKTDTSFKANIFYKNKIVGSFEVIVQD